MYKQIQCNYIVRSTLHGFTCGCDRRTTPSVHDVDRGDDADALTLTPTTFGLDYIRCSAPHMANPNCLSGPTAASAHALLELAARGLLHIYSPVVSHWNTYR